MRHVSGDDGAGRERVENGPSGQGDSNERAKESLQSVRLYRTLEEDGYSIRASPGPQTPP